MGKGNRASSRARALSTWKSKTGKREKGEKEEDLEPLTKLRLVTLSPSATLRINSAKGLVFARTEEILRCAQNDNTDAQAVLLGALKDSDAAPKLSFLSFLFAF